MRKHPSGDVAEPACLPLDRVVTSIGSDRATSEVLGYELDHLSSVSVLADRDAGSHLPTDPDAGSRADRNREASFSIEIARDIRPDVDQGARARVLRRSYICHLVDPKVRLGQETSPILSDQSLRGHACQQRTSHGIAHSSNCLGFAVMSGCVYRAITLPVGSSSYPTRNFATLGILVTPHTIV